MSGGLLPALTSLGGVEGASRGPGLKVPPWPLDGAPQTGSLQTTSLPETTPRAPSREGWPTGRCISAQHLVKSLTWRPVPAG